MIVIVAPMKREVPARIQRRTSGSVRVQVTGVGRARATAAMEAILETGPAPEAVLALGFATALREELRTGDLVLGCRLLAAGEDSPIPCDKGMLSAAERVVARPVARPHFVGDSLTVEDALRTSEQKLCHGAMTGALVATMEDYWLASICSLRGIPFLGVRAVLDIASQELPAFVTGLGDRSMPVQLALVALNLAMRPRQIPAVAKLREQVNQARDSLAAFALPFLDEFDSSPEALANYGHTVVLAGTTAGASGASSGNGGGV